MFHFWSLIGLSKEENRGHLPLLMLTVRIRQRLKKFWIAKCTIGSSFISSNGLVTRWRIMSGLQLQIEQKQMNTLQNSIWSTHVNRYLRICIERNGVNPPRPIINLSPYDQPVRPPTIPEIVACERKGIVRVSYATHGLTLPLTPLFSFLRSIVDYLSCSLNLYRSRLALLSAKIMTHFLVTIWSIMCDSRLHEDVYW